MVTLLFSSFMMHSRDTHTSSQYEQKKVLDPFRTKYRQGNSDLQNDFRLQRNDTHVYLANHVMQGLRSIYWPTCSVATGIECVLFTLYWERKSYYLVRNRISHTHVYNKASVKQKDKKFTFRKSCAIKTFPVIDMFHIKSKITPCQVGCVWTLLSFIDKHVDCSIFLKLILPRWKTNYCKRQKG